MQIVSFLRAAASPALALAGVALLAFGVADWQRFYRELYAEEQAALLALHEATEDARYRRTGDVEDRWTVPDPNEAVPAGAPFAGRVESVWVNRPRTDRQMFTKEFQRVPQTVRDRVHRLPGLVSYREDLGSYIWATRQPLEPAKLLKRELPAFEPPLHPAALDAEFPDGEPIDESERAELLETIERAWRAAEPGDVPRLTVSDAYGYVVDLHDGERSWRYERTPSDLRGPTPSSGVHERIEFSDGETFRAIDAFRDERFFLEKRPAGEPFLPPEPARPHESPFYPAMIFVTYLDVDEGLLDLSAQPAKAIERVDDRRVRIAFDPFEVSDAHRSFRLIDAQVVLRSDMNWALERAAARVEWFSIDWREAYPDAPPQYVETYQEVRRLARAGERVYAAERLRRIHRLAKEGNEPTEPRETSERFAVRFDPQYSEAVFDPGAYPVTAMPEPARLPTLRRYRVSFAAGFVAFGLAGAGVVSGGVVRRRLRARAAAERASSGPPANASRAPLLPGLRFGLASLGAAALLTISAAGWFRSKLDAVEEEHAALESLSRPGVEFEIERREPSFPWSWFASESWPLDSPVVAIRIVGELPEEAIDPVLRLPEVEQFSWGEFEFDFFDQPIEDPDFANVYNFSGKESPVEAAFDAPLPRGEPATPEESRRVVAETFQAWANARRDFPDRYVVRRRVGDLGGSDHPQAPLDPVVARDGDRIALCWASEFFEIPQAICDDGRFLYWFEASRSQPPYGWRLRERHGRRSADRSRIERWLPPPDERRPLPDFALYEEPVPTRSLREVLNQEPLAVNVVAVERLPEGRWRIEFEPPRVAPYDEIGFDYYFIRTWFVVVDEALDWAIVERYVESYGPDHGDDPFEEARYAGRPTPFDFDADRCDYRTIDRVEMHDGTPIVIQSRTCRDQHAPDGYEYPQTLVYSYDFDPAFGDGAFRMPLAEGEPAPAPRTPPAFAWFQATALLACGIFGYGFVRRLLSRRRAASAAT